MAVKMRTQYLSTYCHMNVTQMYKCVHFEVSMKIISRVININGKDQL